MNICLVLLLVIITVQCQLRLKDNGYEGLYIVLDENVNENATIIERLKTIFTEASETLFKATNSSAYFRNITIVIPKSWNIHPAYELISDLSSLRDEHIIVQYPCDGSKMRPPFVRQYGPCGHRGLDMILDPMTLLRNETEYGRWDKVIVHMWAHLRWGVFDENIVSPSMTSLKNLQFDFDTRVWKPIKCTDKIQGNNYIDCDSKRPCNIKQNSAPENNCRFCPLTDQETRASLMFSSNILSVDSFCDEDHNKNVNSFHNIMCSGRSVWDVMRDHSDFAKANTSIPVSERRHPTFRLVQRRSKVRVFLLDISGSMSGLRIEHLYRSARYIIENLLQDNTYLAIITFSSTANVTAKARLIASDSDRQYLVDALPRTVEGWTSIGAGLTEVLQHLRSVDLENAEVFLISDGEENTAPFIDDVIDDVKQSHLIVHTIAVSQDADMKLKNLAQGTGGRSLTYLETPSITFLDVFSQAVISGHVLPDSSVPVIVYSYSLKVDGSGKAKGNFKLDTGIGFDTKITVMTSTSTNMTLSVSGPSFSLHKKVFTFDTVPIPEKGKVAPAGEYFFTIAADWATDVNIYVSSFPIRNTTDVVRVTTWFSGTTIDFTAQDDIILFVSIDQCRLPVINATVLARMDVEGDETIITLGDNGTGADLKKDDGIYSGYILKKYISSNGRHNMKVFIEGISDTYYKSPEVTTRINKRSTHQINSTTLFTRVSIPDEIVVINYTPNQGDITPPDRIKNFRVIQVAGKSKYLLTWTATGDDRDQGQAQRYDIRNSDNIDTIRYNFSAALPVENITMSPLPSGEEELIALHGITDDENQEETSFLAIRAIDESGNAGDVSNIISLVRARSFNVIENNITEDLISSTQESLPFPTNRRDEVNNTAIMLSSIVAGMCVLLAVIVSILLVNTFKKKAKVGHGFPADSMNKLGPSKMYFNLDRILEEQKTPPEAWHTDLLPPPYQK